MKVSTLIKTASEKLNSFESAQLDAEILLTHSLGKSKEWLFSHPDSEVADKQIVRFEKNLAKRLSGIPIAQIVNNKEFYGLDFFVDENVLTPRPETELLVEEIIKIKPKTLLDVGTGSGCIAITAAKNIPDCKISACDISNEALKIAKKNAKIHQVTVNFFESNLLENIRTNAEVIVANLPYIPDDSPELETNVKAHEPNIALFAGKDGLLLIKKLLKQILNLNKKPRFILLEIGIGQSDKIEAVVKSIFSKSKIEFIKDLAGIKRVAKIYPIILKRIMPRSPDQSGRRGIELIN